MTKRETYVDITESCLVRKNVDRITGVIDIHEADGTYIASFELDTIEPAGYSIGPGAILKKVKAE